MKVQRIMTWAPSSRSIIIESILLTHDCARHNYYMIYIMEYHQRYYHQHHHDCYYSVVITVTFLIALNY